MKPLDSVLVIKFSSIEMHWRFNQAGSGRITNHVNNGNNDDGGNAIEIYKAGSHIGD